MTDTRLIEAAFPLKQASLDSVHEKNVRHGHISTLHIWPARRPLAACRAALIATLLPDPGNAEERQKLLEKLGGTVVEVVKKKKLPSGRVEGKKVEETVGGILHWGRESGPDLEWFRQKIRAAYGGRAPKVLDPFAGGGAIPLEAMRLGCEVTAIDINPVAWFILKCTLEYPQKLAGQYRPLPKFALESPEFMEGFFKGTGKLTKKQLERNLQAVQENLFPPPDVDLAWHVRAWGWWVLNQARKELARFYPTYADFEPIDKTGNAWEQRAPKLVPLHNDGTLDLESLNAEFDKRYLENKRNPRWIAKPTVAYLWARTVTCKNCRAQVPLLKTLWLCKKDNNRVLLTVQPNAEKTGVVFGVQADVPQVGGNAAQRREHDKRIGTGTVSRSGAFCICCGEPGSVALTTEDIQQEALAGRSDEIMIAAVIDTASGKNFRSILSEDIKAWQSCLEYHASAIATDPIGPLNESIDPRRPSPNARGLSGLTRYGICSFNKVFNERQQIALFILARSMRLLRSILREHGYEDVWSSAISDLLALSIDKVADYNSKFCTWHINRQTIGHTFARFALPMTTDYSESNPIGDMTGGFLGAITWTALCLEHLQTASAGMASIQLGSADEKVPGTFDLILTDPPYYDAIPYADISDFFYIWLRRSIGQNYWSVFKEPLVSKEREIIQHAGRLDGDNERAKAFYEDGMYHSFEAAHQALTTHGKMVVVFAHKQPDAWETLVSAMIRAGFVVTASWPIQTEMPNKTAGGARLASSIWLVCKKRPETARPGWDNRVLEEMRQNIATRLRDFWDAGIRGPDFVWAATGPALEAYSKHPVVKKANESGQLMTVAEFLRYVRRIVVDFVVGRVLSGNSDAEAVSGLDDVTTYYLLHRHDFQLDDAPIGACILYAVSCGLSDSALADQYDILVRTGGQPEAEDDDEEVSPEDADVEPEEGTGSKVKLKSWSHRTRKSLGYEAPGGRPVPLIDQIHRLMHLWKAGDVIKVDEYLEAKALRRNALFQQLLQALIELAPAGSEERSLLESISNHVVARGVAAEQAQRPLPGL